MEAVGSAGPGVAQVATLATRPPKDEHSSRSPEEPVAELARAVEAARPRSRRPPHALREHEERRLVAEVLAPKGPLAERKKRVFFRQAGRALVTYPRRYA